MPQVLMQPTITWLGRFSPPELEQLFWQAPSTRRGTAHYDIFLQLVCLLHHASIYRRFMAVSNAEDSSLSVRAQQIAITLAVAHAGLVLLAWPQPALREWYLRHRTFIMVVRQLYAIWLFHMLHQQLVESGGLQADVRAAVAARGPVFGALRTLTTHTGVLALISYRLIYGLEWASNVLCHTALTAAVMSITTRHIANVVLAMPEVAEGTRAICNTLGWWLGTLSATDPTAFSNICSKHGNVLLVLVSQVYLGWLLPLYLHSSTEMSMRRSFLKLAGFNPSPDGSPRVLGAVGAPEPAPAWLSTLHALIFHALCLATWAVVVCLCVHTVLSLGLAKWLQADA